jgi:hypothetical protein
MCAVHVSLVSRINPKNLTSCFVGINVPLNVIGSACWLSVLFVKRLLCIHNFHSLIEKVSSRGTKSGFVGIYEESFPGNENFVSPL